MAARTSTWRFMMAEVFSGDIDFNNDLRRGDHFDVLFEKYHRDD